MAFINIDNVKGDTITLQRGGSYEITRPMRDRSMMAVGDPRKPAPLLRYQAKRPNSPVMAWGVKSDKLTLSGFRAQLSGGAIVCELAGSGHSITGLAVENGGLVHTLTGAGQPNATIADCVVEGLLEVGGVYVIYAGADGCEPKIAVMRTTIRVRNDAEAIVRLQRGGFYFEDVTVQSLGSKWGKQAAHLRGFSIVAARCKFIGSLICGQLWKQDRDAAHPIPDWIKKNPAWLDQLSRKIGGNVDERRQSTITLKDCQVSGYVDAEPGVELSILNGEYTNTGEGGGILLRPSGAYLDRPPAKILVAGSPKLTAPTITNAPDRVMGLANVTKAATAKNVKR